MVPNPSVCLPKHSICSISLLVCLYLKLIHFPLISFLSFQVAIEQVPAHDEEGVNPIWLVEKRREESERDGWIRIVEWGGDWLRAGREGGKTESRWQSWHLSYTKICWSRFPHVFKKKKKAILSIMPKKFSQVLTLCDHAVPLDFHS